MVVLVRRDEPGGAEIAARLVAELGAREPPADLAIATRFAAVDPPRGTSIGERVVNSLARALLDRRVTDWTGGVFAVRRFRLTQFGLSGDGPETFVDLIFQVLRSGGRVIEVPCAVPLDTKPRSVRVMRALTMIVRLAIVDRTIPDDRRRPAR